MADRQTAEPSPAYRPRFTGHESFACRYAWLPKALQAVERSPRIFAEEDDAMVEMGVGKNMVRSMRFWADACGMLTPAGAGFAPTPLGRRLFLEPGLDRFLEDATTLWLIHWKLSTHAAPLLAWDYLLNRWPESDFSESRVMQGLAKEVRSLDRSASDGTLRQHLSIFLHTYVAATTRRGDLAEDNLDCPLTELDLLVRVGERETSEGGGRREPIYAFRREDKAGISDGLFAYCVYDYWSQRYSGEKTLPARVVATGRNSPGQVFQIPEQDVYQRLAALEATTDGAIRYNESEALPQLSLTRTPREESLLRNAYR